MTMPTPLRASPTSTAPSLLPQRILVVENSRTHARLIGEAIEQKLNLPVLYAATLTEARTALERHPDWFMVVTSLVLADGRPLALAPSYDMLPMALRPASTGEVVTRMLDLPLPVPEQQAHWRGALPMALDFWRQAADHAGISSGS